MGQKDMGAVDIVVQVEPSVFAAEEHQGELVESVHDRRGLVVLAQFRRQLQQLEIVEA